VTTTPFVRKKGSWKVGEGGKVSLPCRSLNRFWGYDQRIYNMIQFHVPSARLQTERPREGGKGVGDKEKKNADFERLTATRGDERRTSAGAAPMRLKKKKKGCNRRALFLRSKDDSKRSNSPPYQKGRDGDRA